MNRNDPNINRQFNYGYRITNIVNKKIYIGVHRTDNLNDGYMGSGTILKRAQLKYGIENFTKEILQFFPTYKEALNFERILVTVDFINEETNYNIKEGGFSGCRWSNDFIEHLSSLAKERYQDPIFCEKMKKVFVSIDRCKRIGKGVSRWIKNNPLKHCERMLKINKNPKKIAKTRLSHLGTKRSVEACRNISTGIQSAILRDIDKCNNRSGKGKIFIYNPIEDIVKKITKEQDIPSGWIIGSRPMKDRRNYNINKESFFAYHKDTHVNKRFQKGDQIPSDYILGRF